MNPYRLVHILGRRKLSFVKQCGTKTKGTSPQLSCDTDDLELEIE